MFKKCIIVIPIYKPTLNCEEESSLRQCAKILNNYPITFICPRNLDITNYSAILNEYNVNYNFKFFNQRYFKDVSSYSHLMLKKSFYQKFLDYEYMLIYQLDAWVFEDKLEYWCRQGYDYIGAPWFEGYSYDINPKTPLIKFSGNGGFSLRNITNTFKLLSLKDKIVYSYDEIYNNYKKNKKLSNLINIPVYIYKWIFQKERFKSFWDSTKIYEDVAINKFVIEKECTWYKLAPSDVALQFSFEVQPEVLFKMNNQQLPFGCHAFKKYNWEFFKSHIKLN